MRSLFRLAAVVALVIASIGQAAADLRYEVSTNPEGITFIMVAGIFAPDDDLRAFERSVAQDHPVTVIFDSEGGYPPKAMELGRLVRRLGLSTFQPHGLECASACALAFLGGVERYADPGSIGIHKTYFDESTPRDIQIVGIVENTKYDDPRDDARPMAFLPLLQVAATGAPASDDSIFVNAIQVRTAGAPAAMTAHVRGVLAAIDPALVVLSAKPMAQDLGREVN